MRYNLDTDITTIDGKSFEPPSTLKAAIFTALSATLRTDERLTPEEKLKLFSLSVRCHEGGLVDLAAEDVAKIKERAGALFSIHFFGRMVQLLEASP